jgi:hypothetical protein
MDIFDDHIFTDLGDVGGGYLNSSANFFAFSANC